MPRLVLLPALVLGLLSAPARPATTMIVRTDISEPMIAAHNAARAEVGVDPVRWNQALAEDAADWARHLAGTGRFEHDTRPIARTQGENLWAGTRGYYAVADMPRLWEGEKRVYRPGRFPDNSRTGSWSDVGHYTQMVWRETREVGCAVAQGVDDDVLVCRYATAGNVVGESPF